MVLGNGHSACPGCGAQIVWIARTTTMRTTELMSEPIWLATLEEGRGE